MDRMTATAGVDRVFNFSTGPAVLPLEGLEQARDELVALPGVGISVLEISHRSPPFDRILDDTVADLRALLGIGPDHHPVDIGYRATEQSIAYRPAHFINLHADLRCR